MPDNAKSTPQPHVLVINDTVAILEIFRVLLEEDEGFRVTLDSFQSFDAMMMLGKTKDLAPDVIILDLMISHEDLGWQFLQMLKMDRTTSKIPVIVCTAAVKLVDELGAHLKTMGVEIVLKPFDIVYILNAISSALSSEDELGV